MGRRVVEDESGGIQVVATYVIWIYHEESEGQFNWSGRRDLHRFLELCRKHGLYAVVRIGPWSHAETRNGGFPDWLLKKTDNTRQNDPVYLSSVQTYYAQIAQQLHGLLWKEGGPVIGIQLENEYTVRGPGRGEAHILKLKNMAVEAGMDVPFYTITGWDGAAIPQREVVPVFGGYPDAPWDSGLTKLPPNEVYLFRFENRVSGDMGAQGPRGQTATSQEALEHYPFLAAEYGGGLQVTYHRRPLIQPDDLAAMLPVQIGSGINLYGYYMFQGGADLIGSHSTLQESQVTGSATDVPVISYDFQAPLGEYGQERQSLRDLKPFNYFLNDFGDILAPTVTAKPLVVPSGPADFSVPRVAARTDGHLGFIFVNNYVRDYQMPPRSDFQVSLKLPNETVTVPTEPVTIPSGSYSIWPVNLDLAGSLLKYATAQLVTRVNVAGDVYYFFAATPGVAPEFCLDKASAEALTISSGSKEASGSILCLRNITPRRDAAFSFNRKTGGGKVVVVLLSLEDARNLWRTNWNGQGQAIITKSDVFFDQGAIHLRSRGDSTFSFSAMPKLSASAPSSIDTRGIFANYTVNYPLQHINFSYNKTRDAGSVPPVKLGKSFSWRKQPIAEAPNDGVFNDDAALWNIQLKLGSMEHLSNVFLDIRYVGDIGRLWSGSDLLADDFYDGLPWEVGLRRFKDQLAAGPLKLGVFPFRFDAPIYIQEGFRPKIKLGGQVASIESITVQPEYEFIAK